MTFAEAAKEQYRLHSYYVVFLTGPDGFRLRLGYTPRKTGTGLFEFVRDDDTRAKILKHVPEGVTMKKTAKAIIFGETGYRLEFGGTIRQEATE